MFAVALATVLDPLCQLAGTGGRFALAVADREEPADADAAGYFLTIVPFGAHRPDGRIESTLPTTVSHASDVIAEAHSMSRVPFPMLMAELGLRDARLVVPMVIAWSYDPTTALSVPGCAVRSLPVSPLGARWPWSVLFTDRVDRGMSGLIEFPPSVRRDPVTRFASRLESMLDAFASDLPATVPDRARPAMLTLAEDGVRWR
jgi:hypothetical protein